MVTKRTKSTNNIVKSILLAIFFIFLFVSIFQNAGIDDRNNVSVHLSFLFIGIFALLQIIIESRDCSFSGNIMHWIFILFFMFFSPYLQYITGSFALNYKPTEFQIIRNNELIILWEITYCFGFYFKKARLKSNTDKHDVALYNFENIDYMVLNSMLKLLLVISFIISAYMLAKNGINIMFSRDVGEGSFVNKDNYNSAQSSLLTYISRNTVTFSFVLSVIYYKKRKNVILLCLQLIALLITCSPIGMPRFQAATVYIGILILLFPKLTKKRYFIIFFVLAFVFLFPFINAFRYDSALDSNVTQIFKDSSNNIISNLTDANFDAYVMLMKTQRYVEANGISLGNQLLGAILFFVPRSIWPNKAYGSGYTIQVAEGSYGAEANVSCPLIAEGYINFGIIGIALFAVAFGWLIKKFDNWFYYSKGSINNEAKKVVYTFIPTIIFFMMRGDLMSTTSFIMSYIIVGYIIVHYALRERKTDLKNIKRKANVNGNIRF